MAIIDKRIKESKEPKVELTLEMMESGIEILEEAGYTVLTEEVFEKVEAKVAAQIEEATMTVKEAQLMLEEAGLTVLSETEIDAVEEQIQEWKSSVLAEAGIDEAKMGPKKTSADSYDDGLEDGEEEEAEEEEEEAEEEEAEEDSKKMSSKAAKSEKAKKSIKGIKKGEKVVVEEVVEAKVEEGLDLLSLMSGSVTEADLSDDKSAYLKSLQG